PGCRRVAVWLVAVFRFLQTRTPSSLVGLADRGGGQCATGASRSHAVPAVELSAALLVTTRSASGGAELKPIPARERPAPHGSEAPSVLNSGPGAFASSFPELEVCRVDVPGHVRDLGHLAAIIDPDLRLDRRLQLGAHSRNHVLVRFPVSGEVDGL